jgi:hypothetical protein
LRRSPPCRRRRRPWRGAPGGGQGGEAGGAGHGDGQPEGGRGGELRPAAGGGEAAAAAAKEQGAEAELAAFPGAAAVRAELVRRRAEFQQLPVGPVGRHLRVAGDANLAGLLEAELSQRVLKAYLVDNGRDGAVLAKVLDAQYGTPLLSMARPCSVRHAPAQPAALPRLGAGADRHIQLPGGPAERRVGGGE